VDGAAAGLLGRRRECDVLEGLLEDVRAGRSRALVLRGEEGVGRTALLDHLCRRAAGCRVARVVGVESEMELAFAGLHQLCAPMLPRLDDLPGPQRDALATAFGLGAGPPPDRFLLGLAVLGLLADAAAGRPLVCLIDDAQWLDRATVQALAFVARRLAAESVAMVFAVRDPDDGDEFRGLPELVLHGLGGDDARALLDGAIQGRLDARVRDRILAETRGNPLALLELPRALAPAELAGGYGLPGTRPVATRIEQSFLRRLEALPDDAQRLLAVAAAEPVGDATVLWRAAEQLGLSRDAAAAAEAEGLIDIAGLVRFRHPLVRSAAYRAASAEERQRVHGVLADLTDPAADPDRRAWHRAQATLGPDEDVAAELERSASRAYARGGVAAAAAFLERAMQLTPDPARRAARAIAAAQAKFDAAAPEAALELLAGAEGGTLDDLQRARLERLRGRIAYLRSRGSDAPPLLLDAARRLEPLDARLARETYLEALGAAIFAGRFAGDGGVEAVARVARDAPPPLGPPRSLDLLLDGLAIRYTDGYRAAMPVMRRAIDAFRREEGHGEAGVRWLWLACPVAPAPIALDLWDDGTWHDLATRAVALARESGALSILPLALSYRAGMHVLAGEFAAAEGLVEESDAITAAAGNAPLNYTRLILVSWRGDEDEATRLIAADLRDATARGDGRAVGFAHVATAVLCNGLGRYEQAFAAAARACEHDDLGFYGWSLVELVEAAVRSGRDDVAADAFARLEERTSMAGTDWAAGAEARSRALLSAGAAAERLYGDAIDRFSRSRIVVHLARARLLFGEWLRRENRRLEAREQLRGAHEMLSRIGARAFAERARRELTATGETVRRRAADRRERLTAQELQVARLARDGRTNAQIAAELFLSARTVEWHLGKVFAKLGIGSRRELRDALPVREEAVPGGGPG
jgi:DNA-binding CsgD family transcriptional regulator